MIKKILDNSEYTFDAIAQTITFNEVVKISHILLITNITDNIVIYNFACEGRGGTISNRILTLEYDTTLMQDTDEISIIIYEEDKVSESNRLLEIIRRQTEVQEEMLEELKICSKYLRKIYNPQ
jgi:hypothetical protein